MNRGKRCGACGVRGHTRPTCPDIKKEIYENPNGYYAKKAAASERHRNLNPRKCSWCKEPWHNRTTCGVLKEALNTHSKICREWNHRFFQICKKTGFGIGSLLKVEVGENSSEWSRKYDEDKLKKWGYYGIVISFDQRELTPRMRLIDQKAVRVRFATGRHGHVAVPQEFQSITKQVNDTGFTKGVSRERVGIITTIAGAINADNVMSSFSYDFLDGTIGAKVHLGI